MGYLNTYSKPLLAAALLAITLGACDSAPPEAQQLDSTESFRGHVDVILTEPFCDVCTSSEKAFLLGRSPIIANVVHLIDNAAVSVDVAQYTFSQTPIRDALLRAHDKGIPVRLAIDAAQNKPGSRATELAAGGVDVRFVGSAGLQHAKFMVIDGDTVLTGSNNFSSTGTSINEENTLILRGAGDPRVKGFKCHFEIIWEDGGSATACANDLATFSPSAKTKNLVRQQVQAAQSSIDVIMHHLTYDTLVRDMADAAEHRGVQVRVLVNDGDAAEHSGGHWDRLLNHGGRIRYKRNNPDLYQLLHHKLAIIDGHTLVNGSGNWSASGFFRNYENYVTYREADVLARFRALFDRLWTWSLDASSLQQGLSAAEQHAGNTQHFFGNLHAHFAANDGGQLLDDGHREVLDGSGNAVPVDVGQGVVEPADYAFRYAKETGGMDFLGLSPHCREPDPEHNDGNMTPDGYALLRQAAQTASDSGFLAIPSMEWSTNSVGNHVNVIGSSKLTKFDRGRFDLLYEGFLEERAFVGERTFVMLNHPRTFRTNQDTLAGGWDMAFGVNLADIPKASERKQKFNDYGLDDFAPMKDVRDSWLAGEAMPDPAIVDATWATILDTAGDHIRLMEVTLGRGTELGQETPINPSIVESYDEPGVFERRTKVHTDFDYFLTRGFRIAPVASHDNHYANWGTGHTSRTAVIGEQLTEDSLLDAIEFRRIYASEDQNLTMQVYADGRSPMGSEHRMRGTIDLELVIADPDYAGSTTVKLYQGTVGKDGVAVTHEQVALTAGSLSFAVTTPEPGVHFVYAEVHQLETDRMAFSAPIWLVHLSDQPDPPLVDDSDDGGGGGGGGGEGGEGGEGGGGVEPTGRLVINEIDYDQPGTDTGEFVEIFNASGDDVSLTNLQLVTVNGSTGTDYQRIDLSLAATTLAPGEYLVVGTSAVLAAVPEGVVKLQLPLESNNLQNGSPDGVAIVDIAQGVIIDALSYEGAIDAGEIVGVGLFSFVEGTLLQLSDQGEGSLARLPNGIDTDDAAHDWTQAVSTPGQPNE